MIYTSQLAKEYLEQSQAIGEKNAEFESTIGLIIGQMSDSLINNNHSFKTSLDKQLDDDYIDYLEHAGIDVKCVGYKGLNTFEYKFTF